MILEFLFYLYSFLCCFHPIYFVLDRLRCILQFYGIIWKHQSHSKEFMKLEMISFKLELNIDEVTFQHCNKIVFQLFCLVLQINFHRKRVFNHISWSNLKQYNHFRRWKTSTIVMKHCHRFVCPWQGLSFIRNSVHEYSTANTAEEEKKIKKLSLLSYSNLWKLICREFFQTITHACLHFQSSAFYHQFVCSCWCNNNVLLKRHFSQHFPTMFLSLLIVSRDLMKIWMFLYQCHNITVNHLPVTCVITT